jgi:hypothetical protein
MTSTVIGFDTETVQAGPHNAQYPYTAQFCLESGTEFYLINPTLSPKRMREMCCRWLWRYFPHGGVLNAFNLPFDAEQAFFRDRLQVTKDRIFERFQVTRAHWFVLKGNLGEGTPFLEIHFSDGRHGVFIDSAKFFEGMNLAGISARHTNLKKLERPKYLGKRKPNDKEAARFREYAMVDARVCVELGKIIRQYHAKAGIENQTFSIAHLAGEYFFQKTCDGRKLDDPGPKVQEFAYDAKFGGYRASYREQGIYPGYAHLDVVSLYPFAACKMLPYIGGEFVRSSKIEREGIYRISTVLEEKGRPLFYKRNPHNNLSFQALRTPITFTTTEPEIMVYRNRFPSWKFKIIEGYRWKGNTHQAAPLKTYMMEHFQEKAKYEKGSPDEWKRNYHKDLMNHLTGKFDATIRQGATSEIVYITPEGEKSYSTPRPGKLQNYFVAAILRGYARAFMWNSTFGIPVAQYMTDSVDIPKRFIGRFKQSKALGGWDLETEGTMIFFRTGCYGYYNRVKGWTKTALHAISLNFEDFIRIISGPPTGTGKNKGQYGYTKTRMMRVAESLRRDGGKTAFRFAPAWKNIPGVGDKFNKAVRLWVGRTLRKKK